MSFGHLGDLALLTTVVDDPLQNTPMDEALFRIPMHSSFLDDNHAAAGFHDLFLITTLGFMTSLSNHNVNP